MSAAGVCRWCGCTDTNACEGGCSWADAAQTVCSRCDCAVVVASTFLGFVARAQSRQVDALALTRFTLEQQQLIVMATRELVDKIARLAHEQDDEDLQALRSELSALVEECARRNPEAVARSQAKARHSPRRSWPSSASGGSCWREGRPMADVICVSVSFDDPPFREVEPPMVVVDRVEELPLIVERALALGAIVVISAEPADEMAAHDPDLEDWPAERRVMRLTREELRRKYERGGGQ